MLKYFVVITGFATLVGTAYSILNGIGLYVSLIVSFMFSLVTLIAWYQIERADRLKAIAIPLLMALMKNIGADTVPIVVEIAKRPAMQNQVVNILVDLLHAKPDPTERHWIYIALGEIGNRKSKRVIKKGLSETNEFARLGAKKAWERLGN